MPQQEFLRPQLDGVRFDQHSIPLELLKDFAALEEMLVEVAKWHFLQAFPQRVRVQKSFTKDIQLHLSQVEDGSAIAAIVLSFSTLLPPATVAYLDAAKASVINAIEDASQNSRPELPAHLLTYFDRVGRGLREHESMSFTRPDGNKVRLTPEVRNRLIHLAHVPEWTEEVSLRGRVAEMDQARGTFELELLDGTKVKAPLNEQHRAQLMAAFDGYRKGSAVHIQAIGKRDRSNTLKALETVEHVSELDVLDVPMRLHALSLLADGWLNGAGVALPKTGLDEFAELFETNFESDLLLPHIYPTAEGGIQAEWSVGDWEVSLEIDLNNFIAEYQALNLVTNSCTETAFNLSNPDEWLQVVSQLRDIGAGLV